MAIKAIIIVNNHGQTRLCKFYTQIPESEYEKIVAECFQLVSKRTASMCNFIEADLIWGPDVRLVYRNYATLNFIFAVDATETELGILDLIQAFVEALDKCFENACELDLVFNIDKVHQILDEMVQSGLVFETSLKEIVKNVSAANQYQKATKSGATSKITQLVGKGGKK